MNTIGNVKDQTFSSYVYYLFSLINMVLFGYINVIDMDTPLTDSLILSLTQLSLQNRLTKLHMLDYPV